MKNIISILVIFMFISSCGFNPIDSCYRHEDPGPEIPITPLDDDLSIYVKDFEVLYRHQITFSIEFGSIKYPVVGQCQSWSNGARKVTIDKENWIKMSNLGKEELMFHELGHCALNRPHVEDRIELGQYKSAPKSIMNPYTFGSSPVYKEFNIYYHRELFSN